MLEAERALDVEILQIALGSSAGTGKRWLPAITFAIPVVDKGF